MRPDSAGELLTAYLTASVDCEADSALSMILDDFAKPVVRRVVASVCRDWARADADDIVADTLLDLLRRLREVRDGRAEPIQNLRGYVVTCAYNRCHERLRVRYPVRNRLRNHLQYLFGHREELALWRATNGVTICGFRQWTGRAAAPAEEAKSVRLPARSDATAEDRAQINALAGAALQQLGKPVELEVLVEVIAAAIQVEEQRFESEIDAALPAPSHDTETEMELRLSLRQLWQDVGALSPKQRAALLLNLRDTQGREIVSLLQDTGTATIAEVAERAGIPLDRFAALWDALPLSDAAIGDLIGASARQVIKLRSLARERLRRMAARRDRNHSRNSDSSLKRTRGDRGEDHHPHRRRAG